MLSKRGQDILDTLKEAINEAFGDQSVPAQETLEIMQEAKSDIDTNINALHEDLGSIE